MSFFKVRFLIFYAEDVLISNIEYEMKHQIHTKGNCRIKQIAESRISVENL